MVPDLQHLFHHHSHRSRGFKIAHAQPDQPGSADGFGMWVIALPHRGADAGNALAAHYRIPLPEYIHYSATWVEWALSFAGLWPTFILSLS